MNAFAAAAENGRTDDLEEELDSLFNAQNESPNADSPRSRQRSCA